MTGKHGECKIFLSFSILFDQLEIGATPDE